MDDTRTKDLRLRFVPADRVVLHEATDPLRVKRLDSVIKQDGVLRSPPIVAPAGDKYVVLDGATRTTVLKNQGTRDLLVQIVPYDEIKLEAWYHVLPEQATRDVLEFARGNSDVEANVSIADAQTALAERTAAAAIIVDGNATLVLHSPLTNLHSLLAVYGGAGEIFRIVHDDLIEAVKSESKAPSVIMFPTFAPGEIIQFALSGNVLPAGITRHLIPGRALNVNMSVEHVFSTLPLDKKNQWLHEWLTNKILDKKVRYYHEPVFVFDE